MPARNAKTTDTPTVNFSFAKFEDASVEPFVYMTKANKRVVFPDLYDMDADEGETLLLKMKSGEIADGALLAEWLPDADLKALKAERLTVRQRMQLIEAVFAHYEKYNGTPGEDDASAS